jgi:hypothetical protein
VEVSGTLASRCSDSEARIALEAFYEANPQNCKQFCSLAVRCGITITEELVELYNHDKKYIDAMENLAEKTVPGDAITAGLVKKCAENPEDFNVLLRTASSLREDAKGALAKLFEKDPKEFKQFCLLATRCRSKITKEQVELYSRDKKYIDAMERLAEKTVPGDAITADLVRICAENPGDFKALYATLRSYYGDMFTMAANGALVAFFVENHEKCAALCKFANRQNLKLSKDLIESYGGASGDANGEKILVKELLTQAKIPPTLISEELMKKCAENLNSFGILRKIMMFVQENQTVLVKLFEANPERCKQLCMFMKKYNVVELGVWLGLRASDFINLCAGDSGEQYFAATEKLVENNVWIPGITVELLRELGDDSEKLEKAIKFLHTHEGNEHLLTAKEILKHAR